MLIIIMQQSMIAQICGYILIQHFRTWSSFPKGMVFLGSVNHDYDMGIGAVIPLITLYICVMQQRFIPTFALGYRLV